jgi:sulfonate transport system ATP-binding protein
MLNIQSVDKVYPNGTRALDRVGLNVEQGEIVAVVGGSGCGKSTLLRLAAGLDQATRGCIELDGEVISAPHECVGMIFQEPRLLPWLTVADNVGFGISHLPRAKREAIVGEVLLRVGLSDGQAQRVAIARALAPRPKVLLLDEPFSALDAFTRASLHEHVLDLWRAFKPTLVLVTHDVEEAAYLADRVVVMRPRPGRISSVFDLDLKRPRDRYSPELEATKRRILNALDQSLRERTAGDELVPAAAI